MNIKELIRAMTLEEKAGLCSGDDFWHTKGIDRLNIPRMMVSDGPHGLRKQDEAGDHLGVNESIKAVCFPAGCAMASSFDRGLIRKIGEVLGEECQAEGVGVILGPAVNIKRSPLCGRNFEYFSEDPYVASEMASSHIKGVQSRNVGTSLKHFFANNQEHRRMSSSSEMDERTAREIYLAAFEGAVKKAEPFSVMCAYNKINGVYAAQNKTYLTDVLRNEWGFDGFVVSDWGAVNDRVADLEAGMDLEMPASFGFNDKKIVEAVKTGDLKEEILDQAVERILNVIFRFEENRDHQAVFDREKDHEFARRAATECMVLLKNDGILPLKKERKTAFIGAFAETPRFQGGGSSHINACKVESAWEMADKEYVVFAKGYETKEDRIHPYLVEEALRIAGEADTAVVFAGLPDAFESEAYDRAHMRLPNCQNDLIRRVAEVNPNTVVVLYNGSPVEMPWLPMARAVLEGYLPGQAAGGATLNILYGEVNPSGRLAETFPLKVQDNPSYLYYGGEGDRTEYREGVFVGYRYYDTKDMEVLFPFGHGLSYTTFAYQNLTVDKEVMMDSEVLKVTVDIKNTGKREGKEVVQLYVAPDKKEAIRPVHELKGFEKVWLLPGEIKTVCFYLDKRAFAYYSMECRDWYVESGTYKIEIGSSSREIHLTKEVTVNSTRMIKRNITMDTTVGDILLISEAREVMKEFLDMFAASNAQEDDLLGEGTQDMMEAMLKYMPLRGMISFGNGEKSLNDAKELLQKLNRLC